MTLARALCAAVLAGVTTLAAAGDVSVGKGETLWTVAKKLKPWEQGASTEQMAWALYRANPQAFEGAPGKLRLGATLKVPDTAYVKAVPQPLAYGYVTGKRPLPATKEPVKVAAAPATPPAADPLDATLMNPELAMAPAGAFETSADARAITALVQGGNADELYRRLSALEEKYAGDADFDYPYGAAAHDTGRFSEAVFILQRAVAARPKFAGARMELARSYYALGDNESARREFETLQEQNPPPEAARVIAEYLAAIDRRAATYQAQQGFYVNVESGYDSNANGAPDTQTFLGFVLDSRNQSTESSFYSLGLGGNASYPFAPAWRVLGDGQLVHRGYPDATFVNSDAVRLGAGLEFRPGNFTLSLVPNGTYAQLDGEENHQAVGADVVAAYGIEEWRLSFNARYSQLSFVEELSIQDVGTLLFGLATTHTWLGMPRLQLTAAVTSGKDEAAESFSPFGRDLFGTRVDAALDFGRGHAAFASLSSLASDYEGMFFGMERSDEQYAASLGYEYGAQRATGWVGRAQLAYVDNQSDVELYDYTRTSIGLSVRKEFR